MLHAVEMKKTAAILSTLRLNHHLRNMALLTAASAVIYYVPLIFGAIGLTGAGNTLDACHDLYGIDVLGLVFFLPVLYAAYKFDIVPAILTAFIIFLVLLPRAIIDGSYPNAMFKPAAFIIILSAVGAAVAMLQKSELRQRQRMQEMKCIYDIGRAAENSDCIEDFLRKTVNIIAQSMPDPGAVSISLNYLDKSFRYSRRIRQPRRITEDLVVNGTTVGRIIIRSTASNPYIRKRNHLVRTLAERIGGAIRQVELASCLPGHYERIEDEVAARTRSLEILREKLIQAERLSAVGEMASSVGHELRNPLNVMRNCLYLLKLSSNSDAGPEIIDAMRTLDKNIDESDKIVTDLLDFTRVKKPSPTSVDLGILLKEAVKAAGIHGDTGIQITLSPTPVIAYIDSDQIVRAFINIITNAVQSMPGAEGKLSIVTGYENGQTSVIIRDSGCGIPEENMPHIFEPLFTTKPKGIGLGLAIARQLIEQNNGNIRIDSRIGKGTTATIRLPSHRMEANR